MGRKQSFVLGLISGGLTAGIITLLTTPKTGKELRTEMNQMRQSILTSAEQAKQEGALLVHQVKEIASELTVVKEIGLSLKESILEWKEDIEPHREKVEEGLQQIEHLKETLEAPKPIEQKTE